MQLSSTDFLIIGGGVIGISLALEAKQRFPDQSVKLIEKEGDCGLHASGRNSGVLHAGFYYSDNSLKAQLCRDGNRHLTEYCLERNLHINRCGKLVVASNEQDLTGLDELLKRGKVNGVELQEITEAEAKEIEPRVKTHQRAIFSPTTSSVNPVQIMKSFVSDAEEVGIKIINKAAYISHSGDVVKTTQGDISAGYVINSAGLYADRIARDYGFSEKYRILPFKGIYLYSSQPAGAMRTNIYPVPALDKPFLGVHFTIAVDGKIKIGPTAIPAFWREQYEGTKNFKLDEFLEVVWRETKLFYSNQFGFRQLAFDELKKYNRKWLVELASSLATDIKHEDYTTWGKPGIRAQLINIETNRLEMDFKVEGDDKSLHVLNAVSPAFTSSIPFAKLCLDKVIEHTQ